MLGSRLYTSQQVVGSLNLYDPEPGAFDEADADVAHMLARHAAVAMQHARGDEHLRKAVDARNLVGQAQGILMERFDLDADRALRGAAPLLPAPQHASCTWWPSSSSTAGPCPRADLRPGVRAARPRCRRISAQVLPR